MNGILSGNMDKNVKYSLPFLLFPGSNFKGSYQLKAATCRFITLSVDSLDYQYLHHVIVYALLYIYRYLLVSYTDAYLSLQ